MAISRFFNDFFNNGKSKVPKANPAPTIGPINGDISMAPIMTAVEFTFNPTDATTIAQARIQALAPRKEILLTTFSRTASFFSSPWCRSKNRNILFINLLLY
ncbi:hypothetical protein D3C71_1490640 [compost metagenome]